MLSTLREREKRTILRKVKNGDIKFKGGVFVYEDGNEFNIGGDNNDNDSGSDSNNEEEERKADSSSDEF